MAGDLPDPGTAGTLEELTACLRALKIHTGDPSFTVIRDRINRVRESGDEVARATVVDCFKPGRRRLNTDLVLAIVRALHDSAAYADRWRQALRLTTSQAVAAQQVRVSGTLPPDLAEFSGRQAELDRMDSLADGSDGFVASIEGMPGVGKTQLAVHLAHRFTSRRVVYVNLRGFHPDPAQPSADPAAVLDAFLRLFGIPGTQVPHKLDDRIALYRERLADEPTLVVLDDAADEAQARPLLADVPGGITLVTSRRRLADLTATQVAVHAFPLDVFTAEEARAYVADAVPQIAVGHDPAAAGRLAARCGGLPLALGLLIGHMRVTPGWTVTDHADRLDERHAARRLDSEVDITLGQSYQSLPPEHRRLLRFLALPPGPDVAHHAAAALADVSLPVADTLLRQLERDHLIRASGNDRFVMHDLVRAFAADRAVDEDSPAARRAALTRLFDHYTSTANAAIDRWHPAESLMRPTYTSDVVFPDPAAARAWLDTERPVLVAMSAYAAEHGWRQHAVDLSGVLYRYLVAHPDDALQVHGNASTAARENGDPAAEATALIGLGAAHCVRGDHATGVADLERALTLYRRVGDRLGEARARSNLGNAVLWQGRPADAITHMTAGLALFNELGVTAGATNTLTCLGYAEYLQGNYTAAVSHHEQALANYREAGNASGEAVALTNLGLAESELDHPTRAAARLDRAVTITREIGDRTNEANALEALGRVFIRLGDPSRALDPLHRALELCRQVGYKRGEANARAGLERAEKAIGTP